MNKPDFKLRKILENTLRKKGIEFRRGNAGGGNQLRQPYLKPYLKNINLANKVTLVAVSKQQSIDKIIQAINCGQNIFGENYLQEALEKIDLLKEYKLDWHFIGPIQSNKCKLIAENFSWVHTIDR